MNRTIRKTLILLTSFTVLLPILVMTLSVFIAIQQGINKTVLERNEILAKSIALSIEQQIKDASTLLNSMSSISDYTLLEKSLIQSGIYESVFIIDKSGTVLTVLPEGDVFSGFDFSHQTYIMKLLKDNTQNPVYSPVFISTRTKNPTIVVAVRHPSGILAGYLNLSWLSRLPTTLSSEKLTDLSIADRYGTVVANRNRSLVEEQVTIASTELFSWARKQKSGTLLHQYNNYSLVTSLSYIPGPDWYVFISELESFAFRATRDVLNIALVASLISFILATLFGYYMGRNILVSLTILTDEALQVQGRVYRTIEHRSSYIEINRLIEAFNTMSQEVRTREHQFEEANRELQQTLEQKDTLLREVHHRVKNNMQIISSLLTLQADELACEEDQELFENSKLRIQSMAMVHEKIYQSAGVESLALKEYIQDLVELILSNHHTYFEYSVAGDDVIISLNQAIPCALAVFEACINAIKYGKRSDGSGRIDISITKFSNNLLTITIKDNGSGFPKDFNADHTHSMGFSLMKGLMDQLKGTFSWYTSQGAVIEFSFPLQ
ncbi:sensor histidine kinase [Gracilinema caldarium]|uniref:histidine kinase n=1 Tax=Gracilinema caldarium (strain ATCC 51460 / DSM 7334 / H1) TaxID=744872 RepID=F8F488_GRAC1|nr:sensor histidine kinase [Gracilinema caldarium]AEJ20535.1 signal transduction histidine kinase [Gracilinema caldarium DSM 7334]